MHSLNPIPAWVTWNFYQKMKSKNLGPNTHIPTSSSHLSNQTSNLSFYNFEKFARQIFDDRQAKFVIVKSDIKQTHLESLEWEKSSGFLDIIQTNSFGNNFYVMHLKRHFNTFLFRTVLTLSLTPPKYLNYSKLLFILFFF